MSTVPLTDVSAREWSILTGAVNGLEIDETAGGALHLCAHAQGRQWIVETEFGQVVVEIDDDEGIYCEFGWLPISDRVRQFAVHADTPEVVLSLADDRTVVVADGIVTAAIDLVPQRRPAPRPVQFHRSAHTTVPLCEFVSALRRARYLPFGVSSDPSTAPLPPMWMEVTDTSLALHVDWTEAGAPRATYRVEAGAGEGQFTVAVPHACIDRFLRSHATVDEHTDQPITISLGHAHDGDDERSALRLEARDWTMMLWLTHPLEDRWATRIERMLDDDDGLDVLDRNHIEWLVSHRRRDVHVVLHHGQPDVARVSTVLMNGIDESIELLRELGQLNAAATGVRYWFHDDAVHAVADVRCSDLASLPAVIRDVATAADTYGPMLTALAA